MKRLLSITVTTWAFTIVACTLICLAPGSVFGQQSKSNFSGTWVLNEQKSTVKKAPPPSRSQTLQMKQPNSPAASSAKQNTATQPPQKRVISMQVSSSSDRSKDAVDKNGDTLTVTQKANTINIVRKIDANNRASTSTALYTLDGKESKVEWSLTSGKTTALFSPDGKILTIATNWTSRINNETRQWKTTEVWQLINPNTLTIVRSSSDKEGSSDTYVYEKVKREDKKK